MGQVEIKKVCEYIRTHAPQATDFETIDVAVRAVTGYSAATKGDLVGSDDAWNVSAEDAAKFAGIRGRSSFESLLPNEIAMIEEAVRYAKEHKDEYENPLNVSEDLERLKKIRDELIRNSQVDSANYSNDKDNTNYDAYADENINKISK